MLDMQVEPERSFDIGKNHVVIYWRSIKTVCIPCFPNMMAKNTKQAGEHRRDFHRPTVTHQNLDRRKGTSCGSVPAMHHAIPGKNCLAKEQSTNR